ncbi:protein hairy-like [Amphibalanus amphitrite]|uniref:protein hairy-like n=1 Tax=Amphibalanus amphitrite TaxID=1232801 RepID=UPI001C8FA926|nr:protein hairy-like [Amphibalanus amphitrite]
MPSSGRISETRRVNKPIMEKRRRARINDCLNELKSLVLEGLKKDPARHSKLEKADILEMAVKHLRSLQARPAAPAARFQEGYADCAREVAAFLSGRPEPEPELRQRLMVHLAGAYRPQAPPADRSDPAPAVLSPAGVQLVPAVLPSGELGYIVQPAPAGLLLGSPTPAAATNTEPAAASVGGSEASSCSVGSASPAPSWDPAETRCSPSPCSSERSFGSCAGRADSPQPLDLVAHNRHHDEEAHWRPW